ncbi:hypothetical protein [Methanorbis furvi]|uniref:hypothetical protein n=1 Tax=Methanorbis furvi TaxID=3028299 RepID=UPI0030B8B360
MLLLFAAVPVVADVQAYSPLQDQARAALIDQISGTEMTSGQYIQTVWPEVYQKISPADKAKLATVDQVWEMESGTVIDGKTMALTSFRPERLAVMDAVENLEITEAEYMQIVWPELWADMSAETKAHLANLPNMHSAATKIALSGQVSALSSSLMVDVDTTFTIDRMYLKFYLSSGATWTDAYYRPTFHYAETFIYNSGNTKVGSTVAYEDGSQIPTVSSGYNHISSNNMIDHLPAGSYRADAMAYASTASYYQEQATDSSSVYYPGWP